MSKTIINEQSELEISVREILADFEGTLTNKTYMRDLVDAKLLGRSRGERIMLEYTALVAREELPSDCNEYFGLPILTEITEKHTREYFIKQSKEIWTKGKSFYDNALKLFEKNLERTTQRDAEYFRSIHAKNIESLAHLDAIVSNVTDSMQKDGLTEDTIKAAIKKEFSNPLDYLSCMSTIRETRNTMEFMIRELFANSDPVKLSYARIKYHDIKDTHEKINQAEVVEIFDLKNIDDVFGVDV
jgi:hypothetical protein